MLRRFHSLHGYLIAIVSVLVVHGAGTWLWPYLQWSAGALFFCAVLLCAALGIGPALLATALSLLAINLYFMAPYGRFSLGGDDLVWLMGFLLPSVALAWLFHAFRQAQADLLGQSELFRVTLSSIGDAVVTTDTEGRITFMNPVAETLTGYSGAEVKGKPSAHVLNLVNENTLESAENPIRRVLAEGVVVGLANHTTLIARDGAHRPIEDSAAPIRDDRGHLRGVVMVFHDVSEQRKAQRAIEESENRFRRMADEAPVLIWLSGEDGRCTWFNQQWLAFTGRAMDQELGDGWAQNVHGDDLERCMTAYRGALAAREPFRTEYRLRRHDGAYRWLLDSATPRFAPDGAFAGFIGSCVDIHDRVEAESALRTLNDTLEEHVAERAGFVRLLQAVAVAANEADTVDTALEECVRRVCEHTGWPLGHAYIVDEEGAIRSTSIWCAPDDRRWAVFREATERLRVTPGEGFPGRVCTTGEATWVTEIAQAPDFVRRHAAGQVGLRTAVAFPVMVGRGVGAVLEFFSPNHVELDPPLLDVMAHVGTQIGRVIERKRAEANLARLLHQAEAAEARFRKLLESAPDSVVITDPQGRIVLVNTQTEKLFGYHRDELLGQAVEVLVPERFRKPHIAERKAYESRPTTRPMGFGRELFGRHADGSEFPVEISLSPLETPEGLLVMSIVRDITQRKRLEEALRQSERLAAIGQMIAGLSHESRNALQRSLAALEMLGRKIEDRPQALTLLREAQKAQHDLQQVYEEVREYAAPVVLQRSPEPLQRLWWEAWENLGPQREGREARLVESVNGFDTRCDVDPFRMQQVFRNLFENSLAARSDAVEIHVSCVSGTIDGKDALVIVLRDNGPGLDKEQAERIFEPFYTTKAKGTGLGMPIVKRIVESHGGRIHLNPGPGEGLGVTILLPRSGI